MVAIAATEGCEGATSRMQSASTASLSMEMLSAVEARLCWVFIGSCCREIWRRIPSSR